MPGLLSLCLPIPWLPVSMALMKDGPPRPNAGSVWGLQEAGSRCGCSKGSAFAPAGSAQARRGESGEKKQVGGKRMQSTAAPGRDYMFEKNT